MRLIPGFLVFTVCLVCAGSALAEDAAPEKAPGLDAKTRKAVEKGIDRGLGFLRRAWDEARPDEPAEGHLTTWGHPGLTALALSAFYRSPRNYTNEDGPFLREPFEHLLSIQREDGAINNSPGLDNYITSVAMMALKDSGESGKTVQEALDRAASFLIGQQLDEEEGYRPADKHYGGQGYGSTQRPDMSNTQLSMEALHEYGLPADHEFFKKALVFVSRCQNNSETNDLEEVSTEEGETVVPGNDGGGVYHMGRGEAGIVTNPDGTKSLRSYGSMTYALVKSFIYAAVSTDDPRVQAAVGWIGENYRLDENPGAGQQGLFYYYHTFAKALSAAEIDEVEDTDEARHDWRKDLADALLSRQQADGSWVNETGRWMESNPVLVTAYSVLALEELLGR